MNKIVIVVLILIVVIFIIFVTYGSLTSVPRKQTNSSQLNKDAENVKPPEWSKAIDSIFGGLQETVDLECDKKSPAGSERRCEKLRLGETSVKPAKDPWLPFLGKTEFRTAKLVLIGEGEATIIYLDKKGGDKIDRPQKFDLPNPDNDNSKVESLVIMELGGTLNISCKQNRACQVGQN